MSSTGKSLIAIVGTAVVLAAIGIVIVHWTSSPTPRFPSTGQASHADWTSAQSQCDAAGLRTASSDGEGVTLVASFPTSARVALTWPSSPYSVVLPKGLDPTMRSAVCYYQGSFPSSITCPSFDTQCTSEADRYAILRLVPGRTAVPSFNLALPTAAIPVS
jgi:hypothetical protein